MTNAKTELQLRFKVDVPCPRCGRVLQNHDFEWIGPGGRLICSSDNVEVLMVEPADAD